MNIVMLCGQLSSEPVERTLPSGSVVWSIELTTPTADGNVSVPIAWFAPPKAPHWPAGTELVVVGAVKRRFFRTAGGTQSRTEVVAQTVLEARKKQAVDRLLRKCCAGVIEQV